MKVRYKGSFIPNGIYEVDREMKGVSSGEDGYDLITPDIDGFERNRYFVVKKDCEVVEEKTLELKDLINEKILVNISCETFGGIDHYVYDVKLTHEQAFSLSLGQVINDKMLKKFNCVYNGNHTRCELTFVNTPKGYGETHFNPNSDWFEKTLKEVKFTLTEKSRETLRNIQEYILGVRPKLEDMNENDMLDAMKYSMNQIFGKVEKGKEEMEEQKRIIPTYIGYKGREITLVWEDGSKTKAIAKEDEELDFTYGFLIAYYKHIHRDLDSQAMQKRLEGLIYNMQMDYQRGYLYSVFGENCGLSLRKQEQFFNLYMYSLAPFEVEEENFSKTFVVDKKFLGKPKPKIMYMEIPF